MKWVNDSLKHHLLAQREAILRPRAGDEALPPLVGEVISDDTLWACTTCGYCEAACPIELEHLPRFYRMRQHRVMMDGEFPHELKAVFNAYEVQSNPWGLPADTRGDWARGLRRPRGRGGRRSRSRRLAVLRRLGAVLRPARAEDRPRVRRGARRGRRDVRHPGCRRDLDRRMRPPRRQRDAVPAAGAGPRGEVRSTAGRHADRHLRSARVQHPRQRVPGVRRALRGRPPHAAARAAHRRRTARARAARSSA